MDEQLKRRLVGAAVLVGCAIFFLPMIFDNSGIDNSGLEQTNLPPRPDDERFSSRIIPLDVTEYEVEAPAGEIVESPAALLDEIAGSNVAPVSAAGSDNVASAATEITTPAAKDAIETTELQPAVGPQTRVGVTAWVIQVGSFSNSDNATALEERLKSSGYRAFVEKVYGEKGAVHRVRVGPELMRSDAIGLREKLEKEVKLKGLVVRYP
jgi:DedD protein